MEKIDKNLLDQFSECSVDEICAFIVMELEELKGNFEEILKFHARHKRMPLRLTRSTRVQTIGIEKLILLFRKKSVEDKKEVKVRKAQAKMARKKQESPTIFDSLNVQEHVAPQYSEIVNFGASNDKKEQSRLIKAL